MYLIIILLVIIFFTTSILFLFTIKKIFSRNSDSSDKLAFSIIIAAKNEEKNIPKLIDSLRNLDYPEVNLEVVIIDDSSDDNTFASARELIKGLPNFSIYKAEEKKYPGKKGALDFGISKAKNPYILITDADCQPAPGWLKAFSGKFSGGYDFVFGPVPFYQTSSFINKISCFENLRSSILLFAAAELNFPYSAIARNFGFRKSSFEKIGGYTNTTEILGGDDDLLLREAIKHRMKIGTINNQEAFVFSSAKETLREYLKQKSRHTKTSVYYLPSRKAALAGWHLLNLFFLFSPFLILINNLFILLFLVKFFFDFIIISEFQRKFGYRFAFWEKIYLQIFYEIFLLVNFFNALIKKDSW